MKLLIISKYDVDTSEAARLRILRRCFAPLQIAQNKYERCEEVDALRLRHVAKIFVTPNAVPAPTAEEIALLSKFLAYSVDDTHAWKRISGSMKKHPTVQMFEVLDVDGLVWGKASGDIDDTPEHVMAWVWNWCSYARMEQHILDNGDLPRQTDATDTSRTQVVQSEYRLTTGMANRSGTTSYTWLHMDPSQYKGRDAYAIAFDSVPHREGSHLLFSKGAVKVTTLGVFFFETVAPRISKFSMLQKVDLAGKLPGWLVNALTEFAMGLVRNAQLKFVRTNRVVDKEMRDATVSKLRASDSGVPPDAKAVFESCSALKSDYEKKDEQTKHHHVKKLVPFSPFVKISVRPASAHTSEGERRTVGVQKRQYNKSR